MSLAFSKLWTENFTRHLLKLRLNKNQDVLNLVFSIFEWSQKKLSSFGEVKDIFAYFDANGKRGGSKQCLKKVI